MIVKLNNHNEAEARLIRDVFQVSYAVEAKILGAINFSHLKRKVIEFRNNDNDFYGFWKEEKLVAA